MYTGVALDISFTCSQEKSSYSVQYCCHLKYGLNELLPVGFRGEQSSRVCCPGVLLVLVQEHDIV